MVQVKTTAPKEYCVRPNSGKLSPGASIDINVMLQPPMPQEGTKSKDKFLVQTVYEKEVADSNHPDMVKHQNLIPSPVARHFGDLQLWKLCTGESSCIY